MYSELYSKSIRNQQQINNCNHLKSKYIKKYNTKSNIIKNNQKLNEIKIKIIEINKKIKNNE